MRKKQINFDECYKYVLKYIICIKCKQYLNTEENSIEHLISKKKIIDLIS